MEDFGKEILNYPLRLLKWGGQSPLQNKKIFFTVITLQSVYTSALLLLVIIQLFYMTENKVIVIVQTCEVFGAFGQSLFKSLVVAFKRKQFRQLIADTEKFWKTNRFDKHIREELENIFKRTLQAQHFFLRAICAVAFLMMANNYFTNQLPVGAWTLKDQDKLYTIFLIAEEIIVPYSAILVVAYDCFYLSMCVHLSVQFRMLRYSLQNQRKYQSDSYTKSDDKEYLKTLTSCIIHHQFLLRFSTNLKDAYSQTLLVEYSASAGVIFVELYTSFRSQDIFSFIRCGVALICIISQLSFYCIPLNYITDEATSVAQGIYESGWNFKQTSAIKTIIPLVIQRSQKEIIFSAGGLIDMNCRTVLNVLRISYSLCTVMRAMDTMDIHN